VREIDEVGRAKPRPRAGRGRRRSRRRRPARSPSLAEAIEAAWSRGAGRLSAGRAPARRPRDLGAGCDHVTPWPAASCARSARAPSTLRGRVSSRTTRPSARARRAAGFGRIIAIDWDKVIPRSERKTLAGGAIKPWSGPSTTWERGVLEKFCKRNDPSTCLGASSRGAARARPRRRRGWHGGKFPGVRAWFKWLETRTYKMHVRVFSRATASTPVHRLRRLAPQRDGPRTASRERTWRLARADRDRGARARDLVPAARSAGGASASSSRRGSATSTRSASATSRSIARRARSRAARRSARG
jgi:hypothetical protein